MVNPLFSIGGIASGLDTAGIIDQLMSLERAPVRRFEQSQQDLKSVDAAWSRVVGKLSAFRSALDGVRKSGSLSTLTKATSSNTDAVTVTDSEGGEVGSLSFTVEALASRHRVGMAGSFSSATSLVGAGTMDILDETGGVVGTVTTDSTTTLQGLSDKIDALGVGVNAQVLKVGNGNYQMVMTADGTGAEGQFGVTTDLTTLGAATELSTGADAHIKMGGLDIYRASNTITDLVAGATIELKATTTTDVTVSVARDTETTVGRVKTMVDAANAVLAQLKTETKYNAETGASGFLQGDSMARQLAFDLRDSFTQIVGTGDINYAGQVGISLTRDGTVKLDESALKAALVDNPSGVESFFSASLRGDAGASLSFVGKNTVDAAFTMTVSQAATVAAATGATFVPPAGGPETFTITTPEGTDVSVTIDEGMTASQAVARINAALSSAGSSLTSAVVDDGAGGEALQLTTSGYGSKATFTVAGSAQGLDGTFTGLDVIADFGSGAVTGNGRSIAGDGDAAGLTLRVTGGAGSYSLEFGSGIGGLLNRYLESLEGPEGRVQSQRDSISGRISEFDDQIDAFEERLKLREAKLRAQFTALETSMSRLQSQGQWLTGALASLPKVSSGN